MMKRDVVCVWIMFFDVAEPNVNIQLRLAFLTTQTALVLLESSLDVKLVGVLLDILQQRY